LKTLILNAGFEPIQLVSWQRALCLVLSEKAEVISSHGSVVRSISREFTLPSVIRLVRYVRRVSRLEMIRCSRKNILLRDRNQCQYCGKICTKSEATIDHVVPRSKGGVTSWTNTVTACVSCNLKKSNKSLSDIRMTLLKAPRKPRINEILYTLGSELKEDWAPFLAHFYKGTSNF